MNRDLVIIGDISSVNTEAKSIKTNWKLFKANLESRKHYLLDFDWILLSSLRQCIEYLK